MGVFDAFGVSGTNLVVLANYVSNTPLFGGAGFNNQSLASRGVTPGTYVWTWGSGDNADSFTLQIIPEPASLALLTLSSAALLHFRRRRGNHVQP